MIVGGMWMQSCGIVLVLLGTGFPVWAAAMTLLGLGTALVYPTLLAAISDVAHPDWRASAVGVYRLWRDGGYAIGALIAGVIADVLDVHWAIASVAALTFASGFVVLTRMYETLPATRAADAASVAPRRSQIAASGGDRQSGYTA
jgi:MFS family permease